MENKRRIIKTEKLLSTFFANIFTKETKKDFFKMIKLAVFGGIFFILFIMLGNLVTASNYYIAQSQTLNGTADDTAVLARASSYDSSGNFTGLSNFNMSNISIRMWNPIASSHTNCNIHLDIYDNGGSGLPGTVLQHSNVVSTSVLGNANTSAVNLVFNFNTSIPITLGTEYNIVADHGDCDIGDNARWFDIQLNPQTKYNTGKRTTGAWSQYANNYRYWYIMYAYNNTDTPSDTSINLSLVSPTDTNNTLLNRRFLLVNTTVSVGVNVVLSNITTYLYDASNNLITSNTSSSQPFYVNFSVLNDNTQYKFNSSACNNNSICNTTGTYNVTIDATPPNISYVTLTETNGSLICRSYIDVNVTASDLNLKNLTTYLYNSSNSLVTSNTTTSSNLFTNFTPISGYGLYYFNSTTYDNALNHNSTATYTINYQSSCDVTPPNISFVTPTDTNGSTVNRNYILVNLTATDNVALSNITINLYNSSSLFLNKNFTTSNTSVNYYTNFSSLNNGVYYLNATAKDSSGNSNNTETRTITINIPPPNISFVTPTDTNGSTVNRSYLLVNVSANGGTTINNITIYLYNSAGLLYTNMSNTSSYYVNYTNLSDGYYYFNATVYDTSSNHNTTETRTMTINTNSDIYCYQESANISNQRGLDGTCALNYTGNYTLTGAITDLSNFFDGNWLTEAHTGGGDEYITTKYEIPNHLSAINSLWSIKTGDGIKNLSLTKCSGSVVNGEFYLYTRLPAASGVSDWYCTNSSGGNNYLTSTLNGNIYDEGMYWNLTVPTFNVSLYSSYTNTLLPFTLTFTNGTNINSSTGYTALAQGYTYNFTLNSTNYYDVNAVNIVSSTNFSTYSSNVSLDAFEKFSGNALTGTFKINGTTMNTTNNLLDPGTYNFSFTNTSYYQQDYIVYIPALFTGTIDIADVYNNILTVTATNSSHDVISNYNLEVKDVLSGLSENYVVTTGTITLNLTQNRLYTLTASSGIYATAYKNITPTAMTNNTNITFLGSYNGLTVSIVDELTSTTITQNVTMTLDNNITLNTYTTTSGIIGITNITAGDYTLTFTSQNYSKRVYSLTVFNDTTQTLTARLLPITNSALITVYIKNTQYTALENTQITIQRQYPGGSYATISQSYTDVNGYATFYVEEGITYRIILSATGYVLKQFNQAFYNANSPYTWLLTSSGSTQYTDIWSGIHYYYTPTNTVIIPNLYPPGPPTAFSITTYNSSFTIQSTSVTVNGDTVTVEGSPTGGTATKTIEFEVLPTESIIYNVTYSFVYYNPNTETYETYSIPVNYYINMNPQSNNTIITGLNNLKNEVGTGQSVWLAILATFIICVGVVAVTQLSGNQNAGLFTGLGFMIFFGLIGWISTLMMGFCAVIIILMLYIQNR